MLCWQRPTLRQCLDEEDASKERQFGALCKIRCCTGDEDADEPASRARLQQVHVLTEQDLEEGKYRIDDVVLPLPGSKTVLPQNSTAEVSCRKHCLHFLPCLAIP